MFDYGGTMELVTERAALLALLWGRKAGWSLVADDVEEYGSALKVLCSGDLQAPVQGELFEIDPGPDSGLLLAGSRARLEAWTAAGLRLVTLLEADYPSHLLTIHQRPPFLFYRGQLDQEDARSVAVVGTRKPTATGLRRAQEIAAGLARQGTTVVSGLAEGIDSAAHTAAMDAGGRTVAVIGTGIRKYYPATNRELQERIGREHLVLSQFWPDAAPTRHSFPMRNAVMSGYAAATVVVEAAYRSGARMQARLALEHGRPVFLLDSLLDHDWAQEYALRPGAHVVHDAQEVLAVLDEILTPPAELVWT
jgi:DNA processing protein